MRCYGNSPPCPDQWLLQNRWQPGLWALGFLSSLVVLTSISFALLTLTNSYCSSWSSSYTSGAPAYCHINWRMKECLEYLLQETGKSWNSPWWTIASFLHDIRKKKLGVSVASWCGLNASMSPTGSSVWMAGPSWRCCFDRLWSLQEMRPSWRKWVAGGEFLTKVSVPPGPSAIQSETHRGLH